MMEVIRDKQRTEQGFFRSEKIGGEEKNGGKDHWWVKRPGGNGVCGEGKAANAPE